MCRKKEENYRSTKINLKLCFAHQTSRRKIVFNRQWRRWISPILEIFFFFWLLTKVCRNCEEITLNNDNPSMRLILLNVILMEKVDISQNYIRRGGGFMYSLLSRSYRQGPSLVIGGYKNATLSNAELRSGLFMVQLRVRILKTKR